MYNPSTILLLISSSRLSEIEDFSIIEQWLEMNTVEQIIAVTMIFLACYLLYIMITIDLMEL